MLIVCACMAPPSSFAQEVASTGVLSLVAPVDSSLWRIDPALWERAGDGFVAAGRGSGFAISDQLLGRRVGVEADVTPTTTSGESWKIIGVAIYERANRFWHLALIESPDDAGRAHSAELSEMRDGQWLAHQSLEVLVDEGSREWSFDETYRLSLSMEDDRVEGVIRDTTGSIILRRAFRLDDEAVRVGRPALRSGGFSASFSGVRTVSRDVVDYVKPASVPYSSANRPRPVADFLGKQTGFFHIQERDGRWWVIAPDGEPTLGLGIDHVRYKGPWCERLGYFEYERNNDAAYSSREAWERQTLDRLDEWGFNLLAAEADSKLLRRGMAHCRMLNAGWRFTVLGDEFDITPDEKHPGTAFPNVFHPKFREWLEFNIGETCAMSADDPWLFGYFLDNELAWWGRRRDVSYGLFDAVMAKGPKHTAKLAARGFLRDRYGVVERLNAAWGVDLKAFDDLLDRSSLGSDSNARACVDKEEFVALIAETYFGVITEAIRKFDPNHMVLGCRFAGGNATDAVWAACGRHCDIGSFNYYGAVDLDRGIAMGGSSGLRLERPLLEIFAEFHERSGGRPLMMTEWSFPALDAGLLSTKGAGQRFRTQEERAQATAIYLSTTLRAPFMVGACYFKWVDQPALGVRPEFPENSNYGLVDIKDQPYPQLVAAMKRVHASAQKVHAAPLQETAVEDARVEGDSLFFRVVNRAETPIKADVDVDIGPRRMALSVALDAAGSATRRVDLSAETGPQVVRLSVSESARVREANPEDNTALVPLYRSGVPWPDGATERTPLGLFNPTRQTLDEAIVVATIPDARRSLVSRANVDGVVIPGALGSDVYAVASSLAPHETVAMCALDGGPASTNGSTSSLWFARTPEGFVGGNGRLTIEANPDIGPELISRIRLDDLEMGQYNAMIRRLAGRNDWPHSGRLVDARVHWGVDCLAIDLTGAIEVEGDRAIALDVCHRIVLFPNRPWFLAQVVSARNRGDRPVNVQSWYFRAESSIGSDASDDRTTSGSLAPRLWGATQRAAWTDDSGAFLGVVAPRESDTRVRFWLDEWGNQHPDAAAPDDVVIAPGETYRPSRPIWAVVVAGTADDSWDDLSSLISERLAMRTFVFESETRQTETSDD